MALVFLPQPKKVQLGKGFFRIPQSGFVGVCCATLTAEAEEARSALLGDTAGRRFGIAVSVAGEDDVVRLWLDPRLPHDGYRLSVGADGVKLVGRSPAGVHYGLSTLLQAARQSPAGALPFLQIEDWPDFAVRGVYYDLARGRVPKLESLLQQIELLSSYKVNQLQYYIEHTFRFRRHPSIGKGASPLSPEDILTLDEYCRARHVELVPSLASFGHLATVLRAPEFRAMAEDWGVGKYLSPEAKPNPRLRGWTLSPANPSIYKFLDSLFAEFLPLFSIDQFNVCCDETWDLGWGQSYELCRKIGKGRVYLNHILKLHDLCRKYGKRMMFWGDIIRHYPELIDEIPKDVTVLDWGYDYNHPFDRIKDFRKAGVPFYACPGTSSWVSLFPRLHEAAANIAGFVGAAKKHGASGVLNTDWGDGGHYNFMEYSWHGYLFGAEQSWNGLADRASFTRRFCTTFLNDSSPELAAAIDELGDITHLKMSGYYQSIWEHVFFAAPQDPVLREEWNLVFTSKDGRITREVANFGAAFGRQTRQKLRAVRAVLARAAERPGADPAGALPYWLFAVDTISHAAAKLEVLGRGGKDTAAGRKALTREASALQRRFAELWTARNRKSEIGVTLKRYRRAIRGLRHAPGKTPRRRPIQYEYLLRLPDGYQKGPVAGKKWPLMLFLHGAGERGDNLELVKVHGPPKVADKLKDFPFLLLAPQCPANKWWNVEGLLALLDGIVRKYPVDPQRIYLTGISMGGFGTWALAAAAPDRFAAIAPICGGGDASTAPRLRKLPVWTFHGEKDGTVPIEMSRRMVEAIRRSGGNVKFTVYPNAGHDSWTATYDNPALYRWLLLKRR